MKISELNGVELCELFLIYCEKRARLATTPAAREWWARMAGNARKAATM